ncbi:MAG: helix-turn-helix transcriptional regulator [Rhodospirillaceae bacterium]|nr:helix-turn-helix transcriptional regulator [Rhodospirillaceae bacterium]MDE0255824.1 helix-turn-helix transcriptional regulator [Rhodospirillaceae bacterium]MDE0618680.1 helix-turn-helix transcriptional regulator [Rhodospirillaceae bacterium]MXY39873.1 helix-turn-helix transcriptional regulator [Rhodospirillaceae bacterium]MYF87189.1 helix-turn-helix transcriptional regulator [Rhodospirillaceae bacterium]
MLTHSDVWDAIDRLAKKYGMSASGLARRAGLDPTTFNKSKRIMPNGRQRWPSTESVSKVLKATGASLDEFMALLQGADGDLPVRRIPLIGHAQAGEAGYFDDAGYPTGGGWDEVDFPDQGGRFAYALEISGDSMAPVYRDGDRIVVSPDASVRRGDRVVVRTAGGEVMAKEVQRMTASRVELLSINREHDDRSLDREDIEFIHRIVWASQ